MAAKVPALAVQYPPATRVDSVRLPSELELERDDLPPVDSGLQAWMFVASAFVLEMITWGYSTGFGTWQVYLTTHPPFASSAGSVSYIGTTSLALEYMSPLPLILLFSYYPHLIRKILWGALAVNCSAMLGSSWAGQVWQLIMLQGVLNGLTAAILYTPVLVYLTEWWHDRRGMAAGVIFGGNGFGGIVFPFILGSLLTKVGFANTVRFWAIFTLVLFVFSIYLCKPRVAPTKPIRTSTGIRSWKDWRRDYSFMWNRIVILMNINAFLTGLAYLPVALYITTYVTLLPNSPTLLTANAVLVVLNASQTVGQVSLGAFSDRWSYSPMLVIYGLVAGLLAFVQWAYADSVGKVFAFVSLFGFFGGANTAIYAAVARDVAGTNARISSLLFCTFSFWRGVATIVAPIICGKIYDNTTVVDLGSGWGKLGFGKMIFFVGGTSVASSAVAGLMMLAKRRKVRDEVE